MPGQIEVPVRPLLALAFPRAEGEHLRRARRLPQDVGELGPIEVQEHRVGEDRVVRAAEVVRDRVSRSAAYPSARIMSRKACVASVRRTTKPRRSSSTASRPVPLPSSSTRAPGRSARRAGRSGRVLGSVGIDSRNLSAACSYVASVTSLSLGTRVHPSPVCSTIAGSLSPRSSPSDDHGLPAMRVRDRLQLVVGTAYQLRYDGQPDAEVIRQPRAGRAPRTGRRTPGRSAPRPPDPAHPQAADRIRAGHMRFIRGRTPAPRAA